MKPRIWFRGRGRSAGALAVTALCLSASATSAQAQPPVPLSGDFQVNAYTTNFQTEPAVATTPVGDFVVVWMSAGHDGGDTAIFGRRFDEEGAGQGAEFQVNVTTANYHADPAVAVDASGTFVVAWNSYAYDSVAERTVDHRIFIRRFDSGGAPLGSQFQVNASTIEYQFRSAVAIGSAGGFVVVWERLPYGGDYDVIARAFDATGTPTGPEFTVNTFTPGTQQRPRVAGGPGGGFVVVWQSVPDGSSFGVFGRRLDAGGNPLGAEFQVNTFTTSVQIGPSVAVDESGSFVVAWQSQGQDGSGYGVFARRFDSAGNPQDTEFQLNAYTTGRQGSPSVAVDGSGGFVVTWESLDQDGGLNGVFGRRFGAGGTPQGTEFAVNVYTTATQQVPAVGMDATGNFVVAWDSFGQDGSGQGIFARRFGPDDLIFKDGFESGGLSAWSSSVSDGGDLSANGAAALATTAFGLQALVDDTSGIYAQDDSPSQENRYRARFYFDPHDFDPGEAASHFRTRIFIAFDRTNRRLATLVLKRQSGAYSVEGRVRLDDGTRADTSFFGISNAPHFLELDWKRSRTPTASDGSFELWIDGSSVALLNGLDNNAGTVDYVRLGAMGVKGGAAGTLFFDEYESRRRTYVGQAP